MSEMSISRRELLRRGGLALVGGTALAGATSAPAAAKHMDEPGKNITLEYDTTALKKYRPRLVLPTEAKEKLIGLYGWVAKSKDYDTDVAVYWTSYTNQEGWIGPDSHYGDHEPVQVEYKSDTGEVVRVRASVYHWLKGEVPADAASMYQETHPRLAVVEPWHQYTAPTRSATGAFVDVKDLTTAYPKWLSNGLKKSVAVGSSTVPWRMRERTHWWRDTTSLFGFSFSLDAFLVEVLQGEGFDTTGSLEAPT